MKHAAILLLIVALVLPVGCGGKTVNTNPRHTLTVTLKVLTTSLGSLQDAEKILFTKQVVDANLHRQFNAKMAEIWTLMGDATEAALKWDPSKPVPQVIKDVSSKVKVLIKDAAVLLPVTAETQKLITEVATALVDVLSIVGGVV